MTKHIKTKEVEKGLYVIFLQKAAETMEAAEKVLKDKAYNAAAINAVHSAISAADSYCVFNIGKRCASSNHSDTADLIKSIPFRDEETSAISKKFKSIIQIKNMAEYEERLVKSKDAEKAVCEAGELLELIKTAMKEK